MAITYPLALPTYPTAAGLERVRVVQLHATALFRSPWSFATLTQENPGKLWAAEVTVAPCKRAEAAPWVAFLARLKGPQGTFYLGDPSAKTPRGSAAGTPRVNGSVAARADAITTKGWTASASNVLREGDYFQIGTRLYQALQDVSADGSGNATVDVFPPVREALSDNTLLTTTNAQGIFRLDTSEVTTHEADKELVYAISFSAVEAV